MKLDRIMAIVLSIAVGYFVGSLMEGRTIQSLMNPGLYTVCGAAVGGLLGLFVKPAGETKQDD
jgi:hypothetical protein